MEVAFKEKQSDIFAAQEPACVAVIAAAGSSSRMNGIDKLFAQLGDKPVLAHTLLAYQRCRSISGIIISAREERIADVQRLCGQYEITKLCAIVPGGNTRAESIRHAMEQIGTGDRFLAIADGDRPLTTEREIESTLEEAIHYGAAVAAVPVQDTIKQVDPRGVITATPDRSLLWAAQTPQIFSTDLYQKALEHATESYTDDSAMMEAYGIPVHIVPGSADNLKITTPTDLILAEAIWKERQL